MAKTWWEKEQLRERNPKQAETQHREVDLGLSSSSVLPWRLSLHPTISRKHQPPSTGTQIIYEMPSQSMESASNVEGHKQGAGQAAFSILPKQPVMLEVHI